MTYPPYEPPIHPPREEQTSVPISLVALLRFSRSYDCRVGVPFFFFFLLPVTFVTFGLGPAVYGRDDALNFPCVFLLVEFWGGRGDTGQDVASFAFLFGNYFPTPLRHTTTWGVGNDATSCCLGLVLIVTWAKNGRERKEIRAELEFLWLTYLEIPCRHLFSSLKFLLDLLASLLQRLLGDLLFVNSLRFSRPRNPA